MEKLRKLQKITLIIEGAEESKEDIILPVTNSALGPKLSVGMRDNIPISCVSPAGSLTQEKTNNKSLFLPLNEPEVKITNSPLANEEKPHMRVSNLSPLKTELNPLKLLMLSRKVKAFVFNLRKNISKIDPSHLQKSQMGYINDWSCFIEPKLEGAKKVNNIYRAKRNKRLRMIGLFEESVKEKLLNLRAKIAKSVRPVADFVQTCLFKINIIQPESKKKLLWDVLFMILMFWNFISYTISTSFGLKMSDTYCLDIESFKGEDNLYVFNIISLCMFLIDSIAKLFTGYYECGEQVLDRKRIWLNYIKNYFVLDVLSIIPFIFVLKVGSLGLADGSQHIYLLLLLKYKDFRNTFHNYEELLQHNDNYEAIFQLFSLILNIMIVAHIYACVWYTIGSSKDNSWIEKSLKINNTWQDLYVSSIYFSLATMITVGYGDVSPQNQSEALWCIFGMLFGSMLFGYTMNKVGEILKNMNKSKSELRESFKLINRYMTRKDVDYDLQARVRKYLEYEYIDGSYEEGHEEKILGSLPLSLREEVLLQANGSVLKLFPMFCENFSERVLRKMIHIMRPCRFTPEEVIFEEEDQSENNNMYLIIKGEVEIITNCQRRDERPLALKVVGKGESFGEVSFFTEMPRKFSARSLNFCTAFSVNRKDFLSILKEEPEDYGVFCMIRDNILLYNNFKRLHISCYSCGQVTHLVSGCPYVNLGVLKDIVLRKHLHSVGHKRRKKLERSRTLKKFNPLKYCRKLSSAAFPFLEVDEEAERERSAERGSDDMRVPNEDGTSSPKLPKIDEDEDIIDLKYNDSSPSIATPLSEFQNYGSEHEKKNTGVFSFQNKLMSDNLQENIMLNPRVFSYSSFENEKGDITNMSPGFKRVGQRKNTAGSTNQEEAFFNFKNPGRFDTFDQLPKPTGGTQKHDTIAGREIENLSRSIFQRYQRRHNTQKSTITINNSEIEILTDKNGTEKNEEQQREPTSIVLPKDLPREFSMREGPSPSDFGRSLTKKTNESRTKTSKSAVTSKTQNTNNKKLPKGLKDEQRLYILEMDSCKMFPSYFPQNNMDAVLSSIESFKRSKLNAKSMKSEHSSPKRNKIITVPESPVKGVRGRGTVTRRNFFAKRQATVGDLQMRLTKLGSMDSKFSKKTKKSQKGEKNK